MKIQFHGHACFSIITEDYWGNFHEKQIRDMYDCMDNDALPFVSLSDAVFTHEVMFAIYKSARENIKVEL